MKLLAACLPLACLLAVAPGRARAQETRETIQMHNEILELRQEVQELRDQLGRAPPPSGGSSLGGYQTQSGGDAPTADLMAQLLGRVQRLEEEMRSLRGRIDEVDNARQRQADDTTKQIGDLKFEIENGAPGAPTAPGGAPGGGRLPPLRPPPTSPPPGNLGGAPTGGEGAGVPPTPPTPPPAVKRTPEMILQEGNVALARKEFTIAEGAAKAVLATGGPRATDAQFLLARALYGKRDFSGAAVAFDDAYKRSRTGVHAPDALIGLAGSLTAIQEKKAACQTLDKLAAEFPNPRPELRASAANARRDAGCH